MLGEMQPSDQTAPLQSEISLKPRTLQVEVMSQTMIVFQLCPHLLYSGCSFDVCVYLAVYAAK